MHHEDRHAVEGGYCGYINLNMFVNEQGLWPARSDLRRLVAWGWLEEAVGDFNGGLLEPGP